MLRIVLNEKQIALEQIRNLLRIHESSGQPPSKAFLLELHKSLSSLSENYPETKISPLSIKAKKLVKEITQKNMGALVNNIRRKNIRKIRNKTEPEKNSASEPIKEKNEDFLDSR